MQRLIQITSALLLVGYPVLVWLVLNEGSVRVAGWGLASAGTVLLVARLLGSQASSVRTMVARFWTLLLPIAFAVATALSGRQRLLLLTPVAINVGLFVVFVLSFRSTQGPMIERFARMIDPELGEAERAYCRTVTVVWTVFFVVNAGACAALAWLAPLQWWAAYTGGIAYALMGLLFTAEFVVRKLKFRRYSDALLDRAFARLFPPP